MTERDLPSFTIIVPTFDRPRQIAACLQALACLDYPRDRVEVIVVDDGSPEPPTAAIEKASHHIHVTLLRQDNAGPATARNTGAAQAAGEFLAFTDDDCAPDPQWLRALAGPLCAAHGPLMVGGRTVNTLLRNAHAAASQALIDYLYAHYNSSPGGARFFAANNFAVSADGFRALGGYDTTYQSAAGEDRDYCDRWLCHGFPLIYAPEAVIFHAHVMTLPTFWNQHFRYGQAAFRFHQRRGQRPLQIENLSFYTNLLRFPFHAMPPSPSRRRALEIALLLGISQAANAVGYASQKVKMRR